MLLGPTVVCILLLLEQLEREVRCVAFSANYFHAYLLLCNGRFYNNRLRPIAISWQCLAVAVPPEQLQSKDKHFPISTQHLLRCCETKTSTFPSLHSTCFTVAKQRQALSHLYTALASLWQNKDKHFPICTQHLLRCCEKRQALSHLYTAPASLLRNKDKHFPISTRHMQSNFPGFPI